MDSEHYSYLIFCFNFLIPVRLAPLSVSLPHFVCFPDSFLWHLLSISLPVFPLMCSSSCLGPSQSSAPFCLSFFFSHLTIAYYFFYSVLCMLFCFACPGFWTSFSIFPESFFLSWVKKQKQKPNYIILSSVLQQNHHAVASLFKESLSNPQ